MDVHSITQARVRAYRRQFPPALDGVIARAKREEAADAEEEKARKRMGKLRSAGTAAQLATAATHAGAPSTEQPAKGKAAATPASRKYTMGDAEKRGARRQKAQIVGNSRSISFDASTALFKGGRPAYNGSTRNYPHEMDPNRLRVLMGADLRTNRLNGQLRAAREAKYNDDLRRMEQLAHECEAATEKQVDGEKLRLARLPQQNQWAHSGELRRRGQIATWSWTAGFYVLCDGMLHEFEGSALSSAIVNAWPVLGAVCKRGEPSSQHHPHVFELRLAAYFADEPVLATVELAAPTKDARARWMNAIDRGSLRVSRLFRETGDKATHMAEVDYLQTDRALDSISSTPRLRRLGGLMGTALSRVRRGKRSADRSGAKAKISSGRGAAQPGKKAAAPSARATPTGGGSTRRRGGDQRV